MFLDIQNFTESQGINRIRPLAKDSRRVSQSVRPGPGHKLQAASLKLQAASFRTNLKLQAPSDKRPSQSNKRQASSHKQQAP
jgi:hypothetical protein